MGHHTWPHTTSLSPFPLQTLGRASQGVDWSWSQCIKSHHAQTSSGKGLPSHIWTRDNVRSVLPGLWRKRTQWSKVLFSDENKFCISFGNQGPRVWRKSGEAQIPCCLKSSVKFPQSVMIWAAMSSAGVGPLCFLKSTVNAAIYQEILEHFMLPSAEKLYGDADFIFQQDLAPAHTAKGTKSWFNDHGVTVLDWPANSPDMNPIENLWGIVKRKMRDTRLVLSRYQNFSIRYQYQWKSTVLGTNFGTKAKHKNMLIKKHIFINKVKQK